MIQRPLRIVLLLALQSLAHAQVEVVQEDDRIHVSIDKKPYGDLVWGADVPKPYFYPLRSASGAVVTRGYPMQEIAGESHDHPHHRGLWVGHIDVNGFDFWSNEASYRKRNSGSIVLQKVVELRSGEKAGFLHLLFDWRDPSGEVLLSEDRRMVFYADGEVRKVDIDLTLKSRKKLTFTDDKDGLLGIRVADSLTEKTGGGVILNAQGQEGMAAVWGKPSNWVSYNGKIADQPVGIAVFDHPKNLSHPVRWHARDYGLLGPNPFGTHAFDTHARAKDTVLDAGKSMKLRYSVLIHPSLSNERLQQKYEQYALEK